MREGGDEGCIRVVIADDHPLLRDGTQLYLNRAEGITVVGLAGTGQAALALVARHRPQVLVLDLQLPDLNGVDVARRVRETFPEVAILIFTGYDDPGYRRRLRQIGIRGYLRKTASSEEVVGAVRAVAAGRTVVIAEGPAGAWHEQAEPLTAREHEVLQLLARGLSNDDIAKSLWLSVKTVEFHVSHILRKLDARSRAHAIVRARQIGLAIEADAPTAENPPS